MPVPLTGVVMGVVMRVGVLVRQRLKVRSSSLPAGTEKRKARRPRGRKGNSCRNFALKKDLCPRFFITERVLTTHI